MIRKIINWFVSLFKSKFKDSLKDFIPKSGVKRGSEVKPEKLFIPRAKKVCPMCEEPMFVSIGQIVFTHRFNSKGMPCRYASRHGGYPFSSYATN